MSAPDGATAAALGPRTGEAAPEPRASFGTRLSEQVERRASQLVLGLDPDPSRLWPRAIELAGGAGDPPAPPAARAARAVAIHCALAIEAVAENCVAVKPQVACFERLGSHGWAALEDVCRRARDAGLLVIADGKRGDIDVSAAAYGQAFFGSVATPYGEVGGLGADALTVNPLLGADSVQPLADAARAAGGGLFVLVRTSNPGAADVQDLAVEGGGTVSDRLARLVARLGEAGVGGEAGAARPAGIGGLSDVGAVVGATVPERLERLRELMPAAPFLLPGVGAQGGRVEALAAAFAPGRAGGLIAVSRGLVFASEREAGSGGQGGRDPAAAARDEAVRLRELAWNLAP